MIGINLRAENQFKDDTDDVLVEMQSIFEEWQASEDFHIDILNLFAFP